MVVVLLKIKALQEQVSSSGDVQKVTSLETELEIASSEVSRLHQAVQELEEWKQTMLEEGRHTNFGCLVPFVDENWNAVHFT